MIDLNENSNKENIKRSDIVIKDDFFGSEIVYVKKGASRVMVKCALKSQENDNPELKEKVKDSINRLEEKSLKISANEEEFEIEFTSADPIKDLIVK